MTATLLPVGTVRVIRIGRRERVPGGELRAGQPGTRLIGAKPATPAGAVRCFMTARSCGRCFAVTRAMDIRPVGEQFGRPVQVGSGSRAACAQAGFPPARSRVGIRC